MTDQELYLRTIDDLENRRSQPDEYNIIRGSALLRQLLIDGPTLLSRANRATKMKLRFREFQVPDLSHLGSWGIPWNSDGNSQFPSNTFVNLDQFLASPCIFVRGHQFSVADLIRLWANVRGGVHTGTPDEREQTIQTADETMLYVSPGEDEKVLSVSAYSMRQIIEVVLEGLRPLTEALRAEQTSAGGD